MHTAQLLKEALLLAQRLGYEVRFELLGGSGGACELKGRKWLFLDLATTPAEQLQTVLAELARLPQAPSLAQSEALRRLFAGRKAA